MAIRMAMMSTTTINSISVNPCSWSLRTCRCRATGGVSNDSFLSSAPAPGHRRDEAAGPGRACRARHCIRSGYQLLPQTGAVAAVVWATAAALGAAVIATGLPVWAVQLLVDTANPVPYKELSVM
jgi:hypothetical protein